MKFQENLLSDISIFLVGVGGIGCEIIKILSKYKIKKLVMTDMDQIELSNLNRQFLFRKEHIGKYKSEVAKNLLKKMSPELKVISYTKSIYEDQFDVEFYKQFDVAIMALDNQEARIHVNKMCHFANVAVLEGGTNSFKGQSMFIIPRLTQCYQCMPLKKQKTYQFCTIRSFPSQKIHCLVWAKTFFNDLCREQNENSIVEKYDKIQGENKSYEICKRFFYDKIKILQESNEKKFAKLKLFDTELIGKKDKNLQQNLNDDQKTQQKFYEQLKILLEENFENNQSEKFDKDNEKHVELVCCLANLRAYNFNIEYTDEKETRDLIGNVTPAISSTNSLISGIMIFEFFKFVQKLKFFKQQKTLEKNEKIFLLNVNTYVMMNGCPKTLNRNLEKPYKQCNICNSNVVQIQCDQKIKSQQLLEQLKNNVSEDIQIFIKNELVLDTDDIDDKEEHKIQLQNLQKYLDKKIQVLYCISIQEEENVLKTYAVLNYEDSSNETSTYHQKIFNLNEVYMEQRKIALEKRRIKMRNKVNKRIIDEEQISIISEDQCT